MSIADETISIVPAPDGQFHLELVLEPDDRAAPWESIRIIIGATGETLLNLPLFNLNGSAQFPVPAKSI